MSSESLCMLVYYVTNLNTEYILEVKVLEQLRDNHPERDKH